MSDSNEIKDLKRSVNLYRTLFLLLLAAVGYAVWSFAGNSHKVSDFGSYGEVWTVDLDERFKVANVERAEVADFIEIYFESPNASVHMHFMGKGQTTPMHLHKHSDEVTMIAGGIAEIENAWGQDGAHATNRVACETGCYVYSPAYTGHEYINPDQSQMLANLVFTAPKFTGNFYLKPTDPRLLEGPAPTSDRPAEHLSHFTASGEATEMRHTELMKGKMFELFVRDSFTIAPNLRAPVVAYVAGGTGSVRDQPLKANTFVHLENDAAMEITADEGAPLALLVFDPYGAIPR